LTHRGLMNEKRLDKHNQQVDFPRQKLLQRRKMTEVDQPLFQAPHSWQANELTKAGNIEFRRCI
jgi:hypothetical protein